jgi:hypothetical protein
MPITLTSGGTTVTLRDDMQWVDEFGWQPVSQTLEYTLTGAVVVEPSAMQGGRPITMSGADDRAWLSYAALQTLQNWASTPGQTMQLTLRGATRNVVFDQRSGSALQAYPVAYIDDTPAPGDWWVVTQLKLLEV